jgi:hypothetical protein
MPQCAVNQGETLIVIQGFPVLLRHLRGYTLVETYHSDHLRVT